MNYYSFHIGDYVAATVHLQPLEDLAYRRLLDMYYDTEKPIPVETQSVSRRLRLDTQIVESVLKEFFLLSENGWFNPRCDADIATYHRKAAANKINGQQGGRPKKTDWVSVGNPTLTQNNLNQEPITSKQKEKVNQKEKAEFTAVNFYDVSLSTVRDFEKHRKQLKASVTQTAIDGIKREAEKAGITLEDALSMCCARGWRGFQAEWILKSGSSSQGEEKWL